MWLVQRTSRAYALPPEEAWETVSRHRVERRAVAQARYYRDLAAEAHQLYRYTFNVRLVSPTGVVTDYC